MISSGINLVMTVIGFAVSTMFIVFVCTRLVCARIQLNASRRSFPIASRSDLSILERGLHGLEPVAVANLPTKKYNDEFFSAAENAQCSVCLAEYHGEDTLRVLPHCGHSFHATCIDIWLKQHATCPVCRVSLRENPDKKRSMPLLSSSAVRYHHRLESFDTYSYHCLLTGHGISMRTNENLIEEDHFASERGGVEREGIISPVTEDNQVRKEAGNKVVESPSNL